MLMPDRNEREPVFITHVATPWLDGKHSVFGHVVEGQDVVNSITQGDKLNRVEVVRVGKDAEAFKVTREIFTQYVLAAEEKTRNGKPKSRKSLKEN